MNSTTQGVQGRSRVSRVWFATTVIGLLAIGLGAAPALAASDGSAADRAAVEKKKDSVLAKNAAMGEWKPVVDERKSAVDKSAGDKAFEFKTGGNDKTKP